MNKKIKNDRIEDLAVQIFTIIFGIPFLLINGAIWGGMVWFIISKLIEALSSGYFFVSIGTSLLGVGMIFCAFLVVVGILSLMSLFLGTGIVYLYHQTR